MFCSFHVMLLWLPDIYLDFSLEARATSLPYILRSLVWYIFGFFITGEGHIPTLYPQELGLIYIWIFHYRRGPHPCPISSGAWPDIYLDFSLQARATSLPYILRSFLRGSIPTFISQLIPIITFRAPRALPSPRATPRYAPPRLDVPRNQAGGWHAYT